MESTALYPGERQALRRNLYNLAARRLAEAGLWLPDHEYIAYRARVDREGRVLAREIRRQWQARGLEGDWSILAGSVGSSIRSFPRMLGFGAMQTAAFASALGLDGSRQLAAVRLGGLFNLGVAVFDRVCDFSQAGRDDLLHRVSPDALRRASEGDEPWRVAGPRSGDTLTAVDLVCEIISMFFADVRALRPPSETAARLSTLIGSMYSAERKVATGPRAPTADVLAAMEEKSVTPFETMALLCACAKGENASSARVQGIVRAARLAGRACWIVDDLCDIIEDWRQRAWSRPWHRLHNLDGRGNDAGPAAEATFVLPDLHEGLVALESKGVIEAEVNELVTTLARLREVPDEGALLLSFQATVRSWLSGLQPPGD